jgi:hypothetical protein
LRFYEVPLFCDAAHRECAGATKVVIYENIARGYNEMPGICSAIFGAAPINAIVATVVECSIDIASQAAERKHQIWPQEATAGVIDGTVAPSAEGD